MQDDRSNNSQWSRIGCALIEHPFRFMPGDLCFSCYEMR